MKKTIKFLTVILAFIIVNLYVGIRLFQQLKESKLSFTPISIKLMNPFPPQVIGALDVDNDGEDEVNLVHSATFPNKRHVSVFELIRSHYSMEYYGDILAPLNCVFFDIYERPQLNTYIFRFLEVEKGNLLLKEVDNRQYLVNTRPFQSLDQQFAEKGNWFKNPAAVDLDGDNNKELAIILHSNYPDDPRGVACFDPESGKMLWSYYSGTVIESAEFYDPDNNGKKEIILTSFAANKDVERNGTSDFYSYVIVLDSSGNERWKQQIGDCFTYSHAAISDLDNDGKLEIVAAAECHQKRREGPGRVFIFDAVTGKQKRLFPVLPIKDISFTKPYVLKLSNTETRIYVGDSRGGLWMLDKNLEYLKKIEKNGPLYVLNNSTSPENLNYLYTMCQNRLLVFDRDLEKEIFTREFEHPFELLPLRSKQGHNALLNADKLYWLKEKKVSSGHISKQWFHHGLLFSFIILLLFNGFFIYYIYRERWKIFPGLPRKNANADIMDTSQLHEMVQAIAHQVKNPISTILWTAEKIKRDSGNINEANTRDTYTQLADFLEEDVKTLKQHTRHISELVQAFSKPPVFRQKNLNSVLRQVKEHLKKLREDDKKIDVQLKTERDISLSIDEELINTALINLMENAVDTMVDGDKIIISLVPATSFLTGKLREVIIRVEFTSRQADREKPVITETDIGFFICKRIIETHEGKIKVQSGKDIGTKIAITIPVQ
jgi:outer membrane protein assembly factor BamB